LMSSLWGGKKKDDSTDAKKGDESAVIAKDGDKDPGLIGGVWGTLVTASETAVSAAKNAADAAKAAGEFSVEQAKNAAAKGASMTTSVTSSVTAPLSGGLSGVTGSLGGLTSMVPGMNINYTGPLCKDTPLVNTSVRVATLSVWWRSHEWGERQGKIVEALKGVNADVICLQDVWAEADKDGKSQAQILAEALDYKFAFEGKKSMADGADVQCLTGCAILSRWNITASAVKPLSPSGYEDEGRCVLRAEIEGERGPIHAYSASLCTKIGASDARVAQVKEVCNFVKSAKSPPPKEGQPPPLPVLCGMFGGESVSDEVRMLTGKAPCPVKELVFVDAWDAAGEGPGDTWSTSNPFASAELLPSKRTSYVFAPPPAAGGRGHITKASLFANSLIPGMLPPSCHYGVVADIRY